MPETDPQFYTQALRRVSMLILALAMVGSAVLVSLKGFRFGLAFLIGAIFSYVSFWGWQQVVMHLSPDAPPRKRSIRFVIRILILFGVSCAIIKLLGLDVAVAVVGLLVSAAAVILEIVYELIYART